MVRITDKSHFFSLERVLFPDKIITDSTCDIVRYTRCNSPLFDGSKSVIRNVAYTFMTDITKEENDLLMSFSSTTRYDIRRAIKEEVTCMQYSPEELQKDGSVIFEFQEAYNNFCDISHQEWMKAVFDLPLMQTYITNGCALISKAIFASGTVFHIYLFDEESVVLNFSISDFRNEQVDANEASRANKLLHFRDMLYFKEKGVKVYDWGNISSRNNEIPNGIDRFKASFNGQYTEVYLYSVGNTLLGKMLVFAQRIKNRLVKKEEE